MSEETNSDNSYNDQTLPLKPLHQAKEKTVTDHERVIDGEVTLGPSNADNPTLVDSQVRDSSDATLPLTGAGQSENESTRVSGHGKTTQVAGETIRYFGDYELLSEIARGGMGVVFKARQANLNRVVALKMILAGQLAGEQEVQRFHAEAEAAANLDHPGIVPIFEVGQVDDQHYFSMGFIDGQSLSDRLSEGPLAPREAAELMRKICDAIAYAHENGVIHRDLKPANILVDSTGQPKVTDFGLAKQVEGGSELTNTGQVLGTPSYMPPEQASGEADAIDARADVYSLGGILYALSTGRPPFQASSPLDTLMQVMKQDPVPPRQLNPEMDEDLQTICLKCLEKDPASRYATSRDLLEEFERYLAGEPIIARPIGRTQRAWRWCKRKPALAGLLAMAAALLVAVSVGGPMVAVQQAKIAAEQVKLKTDAMLARDEADGRRQEAEAARAEVLQEQQRVDGLLYSTRISLAYREWSDGNPIRAQQLLNECPPERRNWEWRYLDGLLRSETLSLFAHQIPGDVQFLADGERLVTRGLTDSQIKMWDLETGLETHSRTIRNLKQVAMAGDSLHGLIVAGNSVSYVNTETGEAEEYGNFGVPATNGSLFDNGRRLAASFSDGTVTLYRRGETEELYRVPKKIRSTLPLCFSPDGRLAAGSQGTTVYIWDVRTGEVKHEIKGHIKVVAWMAFHPDGSLLASGGGGGKLILTDVSTGQRRNSIQAHNATIQDIAFSDDGKRIATASMDRTCQIFDVASGSSMLTLRGHSAGLLAVDFDPSGSRVATSSMDGTARVWRIDGQLAVADDVAERFREEKISHMGHRIGLDSRVFYGHLMPTYDVAISPDGRYATTTGYQGKDSTGVEQVKVWSLSDSKIHASFPVPGGYLHTSSYTADSKQLIVASGGAGDAVSQGSVTIWDLETKKAVRVLDGIACMFVRALLNEKNDRLAVAYGNLNYGKLRFYSFPDCALISEQDITEERMSSIAFSAAGDRLLSTSLPGGMVRVWDVETGQQKDEFRGHGSGIFQIAISADDKLATANIDGRIGIWDWKKKVQLGELRGHATYAVDVAFSPDGQRLLSSSEDETLKVWDLSTYSELLSFRDHTGPVLGADWSRDGTTIASVSRDGAMILRSLRTGATSDLDQWVTVFEDDFERDTPGPQWEGGAEIQDGRLVGKQQSIAAGSFSFPGSFLSLVGVDLPRTVEVVADVRLRQPMLVQFVLGNLQTSQYIAPFIASTTKPYNFMGSAVQVARGAGQQTKLLGSHTADRLDVGRTYRIRVLRDVDDLKFFLDDRLVEHVRVPTMEADQLSLSGCWSELNDEVEFDNLVIRIPPKAVREREIRVQVKQWLSDALVPDVVSELIRSRYEDADERKQAERILKTLGAGKTVGSKELLDAFSAIALRSDATPAQYEIAALQADHYMSETPDQWWNWAKPAMAWLRAGRLDQSLELFDRTLEKWDENDRHPSLLGVAGRALALAESGSVEEAQRMHAWLDDLSHTWKPDWIESVRKELQQKAPIQVDPERTEVLTTLSEHSRALWYRGDVAQAFSHVDESFVATSSRGLKAGPFDHTMKRSSFARLQAIYYASNPPPRLHVIYDQIKVRIKDNRAIASWIEIAKFQEMTFRYQHEFELAKRVDQWKIINQRYWQLDQRIDYQWEDRNPEYYASLDRQIDKLTKQQSPELAETLMRAARFDQAYKLTSKIAQTRPNDAENLVLLGESAVASGRFREGLAALEKARTLDPSVQMPWFLTRIERNFAEHRSTAFGIAIDAKSNQMTTSHLDKNLVIWDLKTNQIVRKIKDAHGARISDVIYTHDGKKLVSVGADRGVNIFNVQTGDRIGQLSGHLSNVYRLDLHPAKNMIVTASADSTAKIWDVDQQRELVALSGNRGGVLGAAFSPDGNQVATASADGTLRIWDTASGKELKSFAAHENGAWRVDWTPQGDRLISCGRDGAVRLWDSKTYEEIAELNGHSDFIEVVRVSPDGKLAASGDNVGDVWVWNLESLQPITVLRSNSCVYNLRFHERSVISVHADGVTRRWDVDFSTPFLERKLSQVAEL